MGIDQYNVIGGVESMVSARFTPWHGLSDTKVMTDYRITDAYEALRLAGLDWAVDELSLDNLLPTNPLANEHKLRLRRSDGAVLGVGSARYGVIQNDSLAHLSQAIVDFRPDAHIESAGALFHGKVAWFLIRLDDEAKSFGRKGDEQMFRYLLAYTSHDGSKPFAVRFTNVRVECMNTISLAWGKNASQLLHTVRHTSNALNYVYEAEAAVKEAVQTFSVMDMEIEALLNTEMRKPAAMSMFRTLLGDPTDTPRGKTMWEKAFDGIVDEYNADHNANIKDTAWGAVMAVNGWELWGQTARGQSKPEKQMRHLLDGKYDLTSKALALVGAA
jgi:phage/plasmid-like protein (TIGR03299 family)